MNNGWLHVYVKDGELVVFIPESVADFCYRIRDMGYRVQLQWYDDATREWDDRGVFKSRADVAEELSS